MHKCVRCGRAAASLQEINDGCPCGSKVFVFDKEAVSTISIAGEETGEKGVASLPGTKDIASPVGAGNTASPIEAKGGAGDASVQMERKEETVKNSKEDGKAPESNFARVSFTDEDVENIKVVTQGVFSIDLNALSKNPVILKDEEGIYYVRIPFEYRGKGGNGKKK